VIVKAVRGKGSVKLGIDGAMKVRPVKKAKGESKA
jgi:hypothetical protein